MSTKVPLEVKDSVEPQSSPLKYDTLCMMVGELYVESYLRIKSIKEDAQTMIQNVYNITESQREEIAALKQQLKELGLNDNDKS